MFAESMRARRARETACLDLQILKQVASPVEAVRASSVHRRRLQLHQRIFESEAVE